MPDRPDLHPSDLDDRIRALVARAVADAPEAPKVEPTLSSPGTHRRSWIGGGITLAAAAAAIIAVATFVVDDDDRLVTTPATQPATIPSVAPSPWRTVTAGPDGIVVTEGGREVRRIDEPAARALLAPDGTIVFQRRAGYEPFSDPDETIPQMVQADGSIVPYTESVDGWYELHDIELVDGQQWLLVSMTAQAPNDSLTERATAIELSDFEPGEFGEVSLGQIGGDEFGTTRLHLARNGLVVGETSADVPGGLFAGNLLGSPPPPLEPPMPTLAALGLEGRTGDCALCPDLFTVTPDGSTVAWMEGQAIVLHDLASGEQRRLSSDAVGHMIDGTSRIDLDVALADDGTVVATLSYSDSV